MLEKDTLMNLESFVAETPSVQKNRKEKTHTHNTVTKQELCDSFRSKRDSAKRKTTNQQRHL